MRHTFQVLSFDWDGTLIDSQARIVESLRTAISDIGLEARTDQQIRNIIGLSLESAMLTLYPHARAAECYAVIERYRHYYFAVGLAPTPLFSGVRETLSQLREIGYTLAIATGKSRAGLDRALAECELTEFFTITRCADETCSKPDPKMLFEIMDELAVMPQHMLMIGDSEYDLQMANNAHVPAAAVSYGVHEKHRLQALNPLICLDDFASLLSWLQRETILLPKG